MTGYFSKALVLAIAAGLAVGCARNISSNSYDARKVGEASSTFEGVVISVRKVMVEEGDNLEDNKTGALAGTIAGAAVGSTIGGGNAKYVTGGLGALAGGFAGAYAEKALKSQGGLEYTVKLSSGNIKTVVQGLDSPLNVGQPVYLIVSQNGRSRVIARY